MSLTITAKELRFSDIYDTTVGHPNSTLFENCDRGASNLRHPDFITVTYLLRSRGSLKGKRTTIYLIIIIWINQ